jgi:hypothetical protein
VLYDNSLFEADLTLGFSAKNQIFERFSKVGTLLFLLLRVSVWPDDEGIFVFLPVSRNKRRVITGYSQCGLFKS